ncbi:hypothetical protein AC79_3721 [Escherichia coli 8-415-05_S4_C1]|nr:hypothetical protein AC79_3721 [Escherichia coli 8-415-05_S4_C1]KEJ27764.1 hypothetical protein AD36_3844 [Escherichia coli 8-415-05_S4_C3]
MWGWLWNKNAGDILRHFYVRQGVYCQMRRERLIWPTIS